ncbi:MAG: NADH:ubiquinone oxidoreductase, partial [Alistipes sp.]|nr:NADH:ubiquinone oxidoreductase [Alistipes sp.]
MIYSKIKVLHSHGWQYIPDLNDVTLTEEFRGRPELTATEDMADVEAAAKLCPTGAISTAPFSLDLGRCLFCGECALRAPRNIRFTNDYKIGSTSREALIVTPETKQIDFHPELVRKEIPKLFSRSLKLR